MNTLEARYTEFSEFYESEVIPFLALIADVCSADITLRYVERLERAITRAQQHKLDDALVIDIVSRIMWSNRKPSAQAQSDEDSDEDDVPQKGKPKAKPVAKGK